ncbi:uncharacterized protein LOC129588776 isoform X2 [Paramacrobiotus metropolitanus]|uniref:uncharacterized protein LOC129588776 isoform X2 n=1 Tax=Paramacrobiotus metropolitanus TaxID=2943436 RepID=UPI00244593C9|nr:uncharacterized protein LOC129588776 isoform X2 [Paramacrobiotus metropolitanus]
MSLYLKENELQHSAYEWNGVDVEVDGILQHGYVIGLEHNGCCLQRLLVDFGCWTQRSVPVDYGKAFQRSLQNKRDKNCFTNDSVPAKTYPTVEALIGGHPSQPWKWYPAKNLMAHLADLFDYSVVEVIQENRNIRELIPESQIRWTQSGTAPRLKLVRPADFVIRSCTFPAGFWSSLEPWKAMSLRCRIQHRCSLFIISVVRETMTYLDRPNGYIMPKEHGDAWKVFYHLRDEIRYKDNRKRTEDRVKIQNLQNDDEAADTGELTLILPPELLKGIFRSLDTINRLRCRRTCHLWNDILGSPEFCRDVVVQIQLEQSMSDTTDNCQQSIYEAYACFWKCVTSITRTVRIQGGLVHPDDDGEKWGRRRITDAMLDCIQQVLEHTGTRINQLAFDRRDMTITSAFNRRFGDYCDDLACTYFNLAPWCQRIVWTNVSFCYIKDGHQIYIRIPRGEFDLKSVNAAQIWDLLEAHLDLVKALDMERIAQWIISAGQTKCNTSGERIIRRLNRSVLTTYQSCDPRLSASYSKRKWKTKILRSLGVRKLNRLCLYVLWYIAPILLLETDPRS